VNQLKIGCTLSGFVLVLTAILGSGFAYLCWSLALAPWAAPILALPFLLIWLLPVLYWRGNREHRGAVADLFHAAAYVSMGLLNFLFFITIGRDLMVGGARVFGATAAADRIVAAGATPILLATLAAVLFGALVALRGPRVHKVSLTIPNLAQPLKGMTIAQISDLHIGPTIGIRYVESVVRKCNALKPDLVVLTGDIVDGPLKRLGDVAGKLGDLESTFGNFFIVGNHEYYAGAAGWMDFFRNLGMRVLANESVTLKRGDANFVVGGVLDPAARMFGDKNGPRPDLASAPEVETSLRVLLAHNPKIAPLGAAAGFDLQLSGHTHAGQFFPWNLVVHLVHAPHVAGASKEGKMQVYVSPGTGTWGPPIRFGTRPELTLLELN
jgi:predicted MPP superfamily phosphohydrolase